MKNLIAFVVLCPVVSFAFSCPDLAGKYSCLGVENKESFELSLKQEGRSFEAESSALNFSVTADNQVNSENSWDQELNQARCGLGKKLIVIQKFSLSESTLVKKTILKSSDGILKISQSIGSSL